MNPGTGTFISMDSYQGSMYDPVGLHKYLYAGANPVQYTDPTGYSRLDETTVTQTGLLMIGAGMLFAGMVALNIYSSLRKNLASSVMSLECTVSVTDWKNVILGFPAHEFDTKWIVTIPMALLSWQLFEAIYATEEDTSNLPGVPANEKDEEDKVNGVPAEEQSGAKVYQNKGKKQTKPDGKARSTNKPSWAAGEEPEDGENGKEYAKRMMDEKYGKGNWPKTEQQNREYSQLKKYGDRSRYWEK